MPTPPWYFHYPAVLHISNYVLFSTCVVPSCPIPATDKGKLRFLGCVRCLMLRQVENCSSVSQVCEEPNQCTEFKTDKTKKKEKKKHLFSLASFTLLILCFPSFSCKALKVWQCWLVYQPATLIQIDVCGFEWIILPWNLFGDVHTYLRMSWNNLMSLYFFGLRKSSVDIIPHTAIICSYTLLLMLIS